jgi:hypothetical protein
VGAAFSKTALLTIAIMSGISHILSLEPKSVPVSIRASH